MSDRRRDIEEMEKFDREMDQRVEEYRRGEIERFQEVTDASERIEYIANQIFQGESAIFMKEVERIGEKLKKEMKQTVRESMKENTKAIQKIISDSILSGTRFDKDNVQYFKNRSDYESSKRSLETELNEKMIRMISDIACSEFSKYR